MFLFHWCPLGPPFPSLEDDERSSCAMFSRRPFSSVFQGLEIASFGLVHQTRGSNIPFNYSMRTHNQGEWKYQRSVAPRGRR